jgi:Mrp family chromosome partitioning ATPase
LRRVLRLRELGVIPPVAEAVAGEKALAAREQRQIDLARVKRPLEGVVMDSPWPSVGAEAFRLLYSSLTFNWGQGRRVILVTSVAPQEGKTLVAANLAVTFAREGARVLLMDCDLRRPRLHKMFQMARSPGLIQLFRPASMPQLPETGDSDDEGKPIVGSYSMLPGVERMAASDQASPTAPAPDGRIGDPLGLTRNGVSIPSIRQTSIKGLSLLPSGTIPMNSAETIKAGPFRQLLNELSDGYDVIVLDTPPVLVSADAVILAPLADDVLLVVRAGQTHRGAAERAHQQLTDAGGHVLGAVLNDPEGKVGRDHKLYYEYDYPAAAD